MSCGKSECRDPATLTPARAPQRASFALATVKKSPNRSIDKAK